MSDSLDVTPANSSKAPAGVQQVARTDSTYRVLIAHPGRQHSHQAALALHEAGYLACYATGIPTSKRQFGRVGRRLMSKYSLYDDVDLPLELIKLNMLSPIVNRLLARTLPQAALSPLLYKTYRMFDRWTARLVSRQPFDAVIAYENSALRTFEAAKKSGAACILDAASFHHIEAAQRLQLGPPSAHKIAIDQRKDREIALADCIFTASRLAAESYTCHVSSAVRVTPISLGADIDRFKPASGGAAHRKSEPFTFVFVGTATHGKGFDLLIDAINRLLQDGLQFRVAVAGNIDRSLLEGHERVVQTIREFGQIGHDELVLVLRNAHCLVLPSRLDSFGMVVPEAMACGLPVIVSDMVGAKELVQDGRNGFIVPTGNVGALVDKMRWLILNSAALDKMAVAARSAAEQASWVNYRHRFAGAVQDVLLGR
jgi:glycosyltransferase involved in cell wall biosynthesis